MSDSVTVSVKLLLTSPELISKVKSPTVSIRQAKSCLVLPTVWVEITVPFRLITASAFIEVGL